MIQQQGSQAPERAAAYTLAQPANKVFSSYVHDLVFICCGVIGAAYLVFLMVGVPSAMIYIGATGLDFCPAEPLIPMYLLCTGCFGIFRTIWYVIEYWCLRRRIGIVLYDIMDTSLCIVTAMMATLYLFGLYWVLHIAWPEMDDPNSFAYCDPLVYIFAFVTVIGIMILVVFWCICVCVLAFKVVPVAREEIHLIGISAPDSPQTGNVTVVAVETVV